MVNVDKSRLWFKYNHFFLIALCLLHKQELFLTLESVLPPRIFYRYYQNLTSTWQAIFNLSGEGLSIAFRLEKIIRY